MLFRSVLTTIEQFPADYEQLFKTGDDGHAFLPRFDLQKALSPGEDLAGRTSTVFNEA